MYVLKMNKMYQRETIKIKQEKGVTLIALIVTIIIVMILAAITLSALSGPNGIINKTAEASIENNIGVVKDRIETEVLGSYGVDGKIDWDSLKGNIEENVGAKNIELKDEENGLEFEVDMNGKVLNAGIDKNGNVTVSDKAMYYCSICNADFEVRHYKCENGHHYTIKSRRYMYRTSSNRNKLYM